MGSCISSTVEEPVKMEQGKPEPAKKLDWRTVGFIAAATSAEVVFGLPSEVAGVAAFGIVVGVVSVITVGIWVPFYLFPYTLITILTGMPFWYVTDYASRYWHDCVTETFNDFYELFVNRTVGDIIRNIRDIWRMPVYR